MSDRVVVVTGASAGIGRATAIAFGRRGDKVALLARGTKGLAGAAEEVRAAGGTPLVVPVDVADAEAVEAAADRIEAELGPIDVWCNVAFSTVFAKFEDVSAEEYARVTQVSYLGFVHGTMAALKRMKPRDRGVIVQAESALGRRGIPLQSVYCGAKHAIKGFTESLVTELEHDGSGVKVTMVYIPGVNTPQFQWVLNKLPKRPQPVAPIYAPELIGDCMVHAAEHPDRRAWWVGIPTVYTILGNTVWPQFMDWYLARKGIAGQQTDVPASADPEVNLWQPADGPDGADFGAEGVFGRKQWHRDPQIWASRHHGAVAAALGSAAAVAGLALRKRR
ncbi:SDR family oxidoreductase [Petropleomorpha daqingensis]|uniref:NAD(P)-dependent dehydrogenase (Short-subunit alcohol dehydrogenase family) n=1 Tax=Petropleomorpha daqingensis TaxID=2026353 RepID=A0A853CLG5_9ACTN|nr:SDR family oxidoreductase [Petropleomorpha daqingensis]NYJ08600.1 NAD(P)-dependent dehydrogenase (short-subunit alcohol dehydrogenase family) [Petropleomorpha daqingensis]